MYNLVFRLVSPWPYPFFLGGGGVVNVYILTTNSYFGLQKPLKEGCKTNGPDLMPSLVNLTKDLSLNPPLPLKSTV